MIDSNPDLTVNEKSGGAKLLLVDTLGFSTNKKVNLSILIVVVFLLFLYYDKYRVIFYTERGSLPINSRGSDLSKCSQKNCEINDIEEDEGSSGVS